MPKLIQTTTTETETTWKGLANLDRFCREWQLD